MKNPGGGAAVPHPYRGEIDPEYTKPGRLPFPLDPSVLLSRESTRILHSGRNRIGVITVPSPTGGEELVIKEFGVRGIRRLKCLVEPSPALKAWRGARILSQRGLGTPLPVAYLEKRRRGWLESCSFITPLAAGAREIRGMFENLSVGRRTELLANLAEFVSECHGRGALHRDLSDGNVLVTPDSRGYRFLLVDTNRVRAKRRIGRIRGLKNLIRLGIPPGLQKDFLKHYLGNGPVPRWAWIWYRMNKSGYSGLLRFKRRLRLRRLAEKLRIQ